MKDENNITLATMGIFMGIRRKAAKKMEDRWKRQADAISCGMSDPVHMPIW